MRITVIDLENGDDPHVAIAMALGQANGAAPQRRALEAPKKTPKSDIEEVDLTQAQAATWNWLVANDTREGRTTAEIAETFGITTAGAGFRLNALIDKGLAHRVRRGHYRAGEK